MPFAFIRPIHLLPLVALFAAGCAVRPLGDGKSIPERKTRVTLKSLISEMGDLDRLASYPNPPYGGYQASSYDPLSKTPGNDAWFANDDRGKFIRTEQNGGRKEFVMMDVDGPGCITRIWSANAQGTIRFYINGATEPAFEAKMPDLMSGRHPLFPAPIGHGVARGWNIYYPFSYAKHMKVTTDSGDTLYYQINYRTWPQGTEVEDFTTAEAERLQPELAKAIEAMNLGAKGVADLSKAPHEPIEPGQEKTLASVKGGPSQVVLLAVHTEAGDIVAALRAALLKIRVDGEAQPSVVAPIGDFFGASPGINPYEALPLGVLKNGTMYCRWRIPFRENVEVSVANRSGEPVGVAVEMKTAPIPGGWNADTLRFRASYRAEFAMPTRPFRDWNFLEAKGRGVFVGDSLAIANPVKAWWGEGDEKIYFDGQTFPSHFGTGTEDYYGYAWCSNEKFYNAYHNQPRCDGPGNYGHTSINRFHILDPIPFERDFKFDMEVWHWQVDAKVNYAAMSYWYAGEGATSNAAEPAPELLKVPTLEPFKAYKVMDAIEAEGLQFKAIDGKAEPQDLSGFGGKWSGETHLWFTQGKIGSKLEITLDAPADGVYDVRAKFTNAPDYGIARASVNGVVVNEPIDFYGANVKPAREKSLGEHQLKAKGNVITLEIVGANEKAAKNYMLGIDYFKLVPKR